MQATVKNEVDKSVKKVNWILAALMLAMLLGALDMTIMSTATPLIISDLGGFEQYSWVFTAYMLTSTVFVPIFGKLADLYGRRLIYQIGLGLFIVGSALCGFAESMTQLIWFRALQGVGGAALMPIAIVIIGDLFPPDKRGKVQGLFGAVFGMASVAGPALGGIITDYLSWEWTFWINLPLGIFSILIFSFALQEKRGEMKRYIDYLGAGLLMAGITALLLALVFGGHEYPWNSKEIIGLFAASFVLLAAFTYIQTKVPEPLVPLQLFRNRVITVSVVIGFFLGASMMGAISYIPLYVQGVIGVSPSLAGYVLTPMMLAMITSSIVSGRLITKLTYRTIVLSSMGLLVASFYLFTTLTVSTPTWQVVLFMVLAGLGMGPMNPLLTIAVQNSAEAHVQGVATSSLAFFRTIGGTIGVAVMGTMMNNKMASEMEHVTSQLPAPLQSQAEMFTDPNLLLREEFRQQVPAELLNLMKEALSNSVTFIFWTSVVLAALCWMVGLLYQRERVVRRKAPEAMPASIQES